MQLSPDGWLLFATCGIRSFAYGFLSVILGLYLANIGLDAEAIGWVFAAALAGGAVMTIVLTTVADRLGRKELLMLGAVLMALAGTAFAISNHFLLLIIASVLGTISPSGKEVGPFLSIEQAILPQTTQDENRTSVFAAYNLVGSFASALGALAVSMVALFNLPSLAGYRLLIWGYVVAAIILFVLFSCLSPSVEARFFKDRRVGFGVHRSRLIVAKLASLFALDSFAGGLIVQSLVAYWFHLRYGADIKALGSIFFGANLFSALSFLAAPALARRIGLLNTMVSTHLVSNLMLIAVPFMPTYGSTIGMFVARHLLSQLDVPTRQSYTMAVVEPEERAAAAGITSVSRNAAAALAPIFTGLVVATPALGLPFLLAGGLKIVYDLSIFALFRKVKPPEES